MNVLSHMLNAASRNGLVGYHPRCKDSALMHLCFADDLLIFSGGSPTSVQEPLLQKIKSKINCWTTKLLSFAGRLQLLSLVIFGIINFWCAAFILPSECIKKINSLRTYFLWKGSLDERYTTRVVWDSIYLPKEEGGVGLKNLESIWVAWIHQNIIKDSDIWLLKEKQSHTWILKKILRLRPLVVQWIRMLPGNERHCRFWTFPWSPFRQLIIPGSLRSMYDRHPVNINACFPVAKKFMNSLNHKFSTSQVYNLIRTPAQPVRWRKIVCHKRGIPKYKTLTWLFMLDRCPTRNRLISWDLQTDEGCLLCNKAMETRDHILFTCDFSTEIWGLLRQKLNIISRSNNWTDYVEALITLYGEPHLQFILIFVWQAAIFEIWRERNNQLHRNIFRTPSILNSSIDRTIKNIISSIRDNNFDFSKSSFLLPWFIINTSTTLSQLESIVLWLESIIESRLK
ncbi:hypothetical protein N665_0576s0011 [Sinapis alba]|nr:hypothetical protein N665_0576s0011 [Sinapis alba]